MSPLPPGPPEQLSGVAVVIIIAVCTPDYTTIHVPACEAFFFQVGVQTIIMLFIFAKRQVMRFALRSRRGPHVSVGQVKSLLPTLNNSFKHSCPLLFTPADTT